MKNFRKGGLSDEEIVQWLRGLRGNSYAPESNFSVAAVFRARVQGVDDYYFGGVNVEIIDNRSATHAEEGCIAALVTGLGRQAEIVEGWVMGAPKGVNAGDPDPAADTLISCCGKCRQQIAGLAGEDVKIHALTLNGRRSSTTVGAFLPDLFTFRQYIPELLAPKETGAPAPSSDEVRNRLIRQERQTEEEIFAWLRDLESLVYVSKVSQALVLELDNGAYVAGAKIEEAAFISMNAAQSAVAVAVSAFGERAIRGIRVYTKGVDGREIPADSFGTLTLPALQTLSEMAEHEKIPVRFFMEGGDTVSMTLSGAAGAAPTYRKPFLQKSWRE
ncbi:MAG: hypothetical protein V1721_07215 [Pseudomonadota bacterium]